MNEFIRELVLAEAAYNYEPSTVNLKLYLIALMQLNLPIPEHFMKPLLDAIVVRKSELRKAKTRHSYVEILAHVVVNNKAYGLSLEKCFEAASIHFEDNDYKVDTIESIYKKEKRTRKYLQKLLEKYRST